MRRIQKKIWPDMFENDQQLPVDFRLADFKLEVGDEIVFREWDSKTQRYTGRQYVKKVRRITRH